MNYFLRLTPDAPIKVSGLVYFCSALLLLVILFIANKLKGKTWLVWIPFGIQIIAILWHSQDFSFLLRYGLPLYHCRIGMLILPLLLLKKFPKILKDYLLGLAIGGSVLATLMPDLDRYHFPHITNFIFYLGHYGLLIGASSLRENKKSELNFIVGLFFSLLLHIPILLVNISLNSNYGFLSKLPSSIQLDHLSGLSVYLLVSIGIALISNIGFRLDKLRQVD